MLEKLLRYRPVLKSHHSDGSEDSQAKPGESDLLVENSARAAGYRSRIGAIQRLVAREGGSSTPPHGRSSVVSRGDMWFI